MSRISAVFYAFFLGIIVAAWSGPGLADDDDDDGGSSGGPFGELFSDPAVADLLDELYDDDDDDGLESCGRNVTKRPERLQRCVTVEGVRRHQQVFQVIADGNGDTRFSGTPGYDLSAFYVAWVMDRAGYDVQLQPFTYLAYEPLGPSTLKQLAPNPVTYEEDVDYTLMSQTEAGDVTGFVTGADLAIADPATSTSGCEPADFVGFPAGDIALLQRGACTFQLKAENAAAAGAIGAIIFNQGNSPDRTGLINATLSSAYAGGIPVLFATFDRGVEWAGTSGLEMQMITDVIRGNRDTYNVIADSRSGDPDNVVVVGAHLDSVIEGPGVQDNGSGSAAILEVAVQMADARTNNKVRFAWWGAEESGLVGSDFYVFESLTPEELAQIRLYLNFDMIGSPNFVRFIYDGDGSAFGLAGPPGSEVIEAFYEDFYGSFRVGGDDDDDDGGGTVGLEFEPTEISFRSDYAAFFDSGIPFGGLFTGAEGIKSPEQVAIYGGTEGEQYDPCYHLACDTFDNISLEVLDVNADAVAASTLHFATSTDPLVAPSTLAVSAFGLGSVQTTAVNETRGHFTVR